MEASTEAPFIHSSMHTFTYQKTPVRVNRHDAGSRVTARMLQGQMDTGMDKVIPGRHAGE